MPITDSAYSLKCRAAALAADLRLHQKAAGDAPATRCARMFSPVIYKTHECTGGPYCRGNCKPA
jgi:hypothetical protein